jgi:glycosyltransferase involved in cell wall biosynthesis
MSINLSVTVLLAVFNGEQFICETIKSILLQSYTRFEFIIINDASTDGTLSIINSFDDQRIKLINNSENLGLTKSLNIGLEHARGDYIARIDADDIAHHNRLAVQVQYLENHPNVVLIGTNVRVINEEGHVVTNLEFDRPSTDASVKWMLLFGNPFVHSSVMFRHKEIWNKLGGYNISYKYNQDFELWSRILRCASGVNIKDVLNDYRSNKYSITRQRCERNKQMWEKSLRQNIDAQYLNLISIFGNEHHFHDWPELWSMANQPYGEGSAIDIGQLLSLFIEMREVYMQNNFDFVSQDEISNISGSILLRIARYAAGNNRLVAIKVFILLAKEYSSILMDNMPQLLITFITGHAGATNISRAYKSSKAYINNFR